MVNKELVREWIAKAHEDYNFACANLTELDNGFFPQICFHFQQSAEKYLKAYITAYELEFKKIHDLTQLLQICRKHNSGMQALKDACEFLTDFYVETRYPVHWPSEITKEEAQKSRDAAEKIGALVKILLKGFLE